MHYNTKKIPCREIGEGSTVELELRQEQQLSMRQLHSLRLLQMGRLEMREYLESVAQENPTVEL